MNPVTKLMDWDPTDRSRLYTSRAIRRWRTLSVAAIPGSLFMLVGMPQTENLYWHVPIFLASLVAAFALAFHGITGVFFDDAPRDEMETQLVAKASADTFSMLSLIVGLCVLYAIVAHFGWLPVMPIEPSFTELALGMMFTLMAIRSVLMSYRVEPMDGEGETAPVAPVSLGTLLIAGALVVATAILAGVTLGEGPREIDAVTAAALEICGEGNIARVSIDPADYGFDCR